MAAMLKQDVEESVSLFPFLSILACIIGILILMITAVALGQIGKDKTPQEQTADAADAEAAAKAAAEAAGRVEQFKQVQEQLKAEDREMQRLRELIAGADATRKQLDQAKAELAALEAERKKEEDKVLQNNTLLAQQQVEALRLQQRIEQFEKDLERLKMLIDQLKAELAKRKSVPTESQVVIQPSGSGVELDATFIECAATSIVMYDGPTPVRVPRAALTTSQPYRDLLDKVKAQPKGTIIFLLRPDGVATYNTARSVARSRYVTNGKLAVAGQGNIDLSLIHQSIKK